MSHKEGRGIRSVKAHTTETSVSFSIYTKNILHGFNPLLHRRPCLSQLHDMDVSTS